ncbi:MAG: hypothetical protein GDA66_06710 [Nitrospira sp. CR1.2]|nr:hypothetical protein [Nitrospira sp. CR1.2]
MDTNARLATAFQIVVGLAVALFLAPSGTAQVIHPDQMLGTFSPQLESRPGDGPAFSESAGPESDKPVESQMRVPENDVSGGIDMKMLKTPDSHDAEEARESDRQSSVSY